MAGGRAARIIPFPASQETRSQHGLPKDFGLAFSDHFVVNHRGLGTTGGGEVFRSRDVVRAFRALFNALGTAAVPVEHYLK